MKKMVFSFAAMIVMVTSVSVFANSQKDGYYVHNHDALAIHLAVQGKHCTGSVGCSCSGFSPITNGEVWQQAYCKYCGHKRNCHK